MLKKFFTQKIKFTRKHKGFSLVELLVSMAIIAVLLGLVGFGIATAQRNSRDSQRRQKVSDIKLALEDYLIRESSYPTEQSEFCNGGDNLQIATSGDPITIEVSGPTQAADDTSTTGTRYCYSNDGQGGYILGALLENGEWYDASSSITGTGEADSTNCGTGQELFASDCS
jgi:prepilin-type N-terminal cleavage/methylation domain-containing protein